MSAPILSTPTSLVGTKTQRCQEDESPKPNQRGSYKKVAEVPSHENKHQAVNWGKWVVSPFFFFLQHLLARWLNDNPPAEEKLQQGYEVEAPFRKSDVATLASILNSLPDHPRSLRVITTPKYFVPFSRPSMQERPHPLQQDGTSSNKKVQRWEIWAKNMHTNKHSGVWKEHVQKTYNFKTIIEMHADLFVYCRDW